MAATLTPNYGWVQPDIGGDASVWGASLNDDLALIDAQVYANEQATVMVGCITMYGGATAPANWLLCQGQSLATTGTYAKLFGIIGYAYGGSGANFNLPNLQAQFPLGVGPSNSLGSSGGSFAVGLSVANLPPHAHPIVDVAHNHTLNQSVHNHGDPGHAHTASAGDSAQHAHGSSLMRFVGSGGSLGVSASPFNVTTGNTDPSNAPGVNVTVNAAGANLQAANANISLDASGTNLSTTQNTGSGSAVSVIPPYVCVNFIIRFQ
jgi:microcystin-dependent protein